MLADNFTRRTFPRLTSWCLREKSKTARQTFSRGLTAEFFISAEKKARRTILERSISPILTVLILGEKNKCSADNFSQLDTFVFHFGGEFYSTDKFDDDFRVRLDKILEIKNLVINNLGRTEWLAHNKNYMSSLAAEGVRSGVLASAVYRSTAGRSEFQPCI